MARRLSTRLAPVPPAPLPPGRTVTVPGRGELFFRDTGGDGTPLVLLHGWTASADLNWIWIYGPLEEAGYRVLAVDHRGHGRGIRSPQPFRLQDCADDVAGLLATLDLRDVLVAGYSMGGPITQLLARDHPDRLRGIVLCATAAHWGGVRMKAMWRGMAGMRLVLGLAPEAAWRRGLLSLGLPDTAETSWAAGELVRGSARDLAEAGRELGRYDARRWLGQIEVPAAVVVTSTDTGVPPGRQRGLAAALGAPTFEVAGDHAVVAFRPQVFAQQLVAALAEVSAAVPVAA